MTDFPPCVQCKSEYTYKDREVFICPECGYEWNGNDMVSDADNLTVRDVNGNFLSDGDVVTVIKDLKIKGSSSVVKVGTKVKNVRIIEGDHNLDCKIEGIGAIKLKSKFVKRC